jgi:hypothetical protein
MGPAFSNSVSSHDAERIEMTRRLIFILLLCAIPARATAQRNEAAVSGIGVVALHLPDNRYEGGPYLNEAMGGVAPGVGVGIHFIERSGLMLAAEYSMSFLSREQRGRLVPGPRPPTPDGSFVGGSVTTKLRDSLLSGLVGYAIRRSGQTRAIVLFGLALRLDDPRIDHTTGDTVVDAEDDSRFALTGGFDVLRPLSPRLSVTGGVRYALIPRSRQHQYLGIGPHLIRGGVGLRFAIN